jgi:hypothetical protein
MVSFIWVMGRLVFEESAAEVHAAAGDGRENQGKIYRPVVRFMLKLTCFRAVCQDPGSGCGSSWRSHRPVVRKNLIDNRTEHRTIMIERSLNFMRFLSGQRLSCGVPFLSVGFMLTDH